MNNVKKKEKLFNFQKQFIKLSITGKIKNYKIKQIGRAHV